MTTVTLSAEEFCRHLQPLAATAFQERSISAGGTLVSRLALPGLELSRIHIWVQVADHRNGSQAPTGTVDLIIKVSTACLVKGPFSMTVETRLGDTVENHPFEIRPLDQCIPSNSALIPNLTREHTWTVSFEPLEEPTVQPAT